MSMTMIIPVAVCLAVMALVAAVISIVNSMQPNKVEDRLQAMAGLKPTEERLRITKEDLTGAGSGAAASLVRKFGNWDLFLEQADSPINFQTFLLASLGAGGVGAALCLIGNAPAPLIPVAFLIMATIPTGWLMWRRGRRFKKFGRQLPDAMELMGRALRSGHSLNSGLRLVCDEMPAPISQIFLAAYETQNLGVPVEQALKDSLRLMPNLDYKFFVTAVTIQRQTGGDLAEILDKISEVIRERFKILGAVQALTGEGRLSGAVLMAMPIAIFLAVYYLNPTYVMVLFTTPLGKQMIAVGIIMQVLGAVAIKKIIDIKV